MRSLRAWLPLLAFLVLVAIVLGTRPELLKLALQGASQHSAERPPVPGTFPPLDSAQVRLGRLLFFDPILSTNRARSCASCHSPSLGLSDSRTRAMAIDSTDLARNAPGLTNVADQRLFFWDGRALSLEQQIDGPIHNKRELGGLTNRDIEGRLDSIPEYRRLFRAAFGEGRPRYGNAKTAIAAFERTLRSSRSTVDRWWSGDSIAVPEDVRRGFNLFAGRARCSRCHFLPLTTSVVPGKFATQEFTVIGVPSDSTGLALDPDPGRYAITKKPADLHAFKAPSLRGIARSAPYMHNGAFATLRQVVRFYNRGGGIGLGLKVPNQAPEVRPLHLTLDEERAIARFLEALSDDQQTNAPPNRVPSGLPVAGRY